MSYRQLVNPTSISTLNVPPTLIGNSSNTVQQTSTDVNLSNSVQNSSVIMNTPSAGMVVLSDSNQKAVKPEYTDPKNEYS